MTKRTVEVMRSPNSKALGTETWDIVVSDDALIPKIYAQANWLQDMTFYFSLLQCIHLAFFVHNPRRAAFEPGRFSTHKPHAHLFIRTPTGIIHE